MPDLESAPPVIEAEWVQLHDQLELANDVWFGFFFSASPRYTQLFANRVRNKLEAVGAKLRIWMPKEPSQLIEHAREVVRASEEGTGDCLWLEALDVDLEETKDGWIYAWKNMLLRLNEQRERMLKVHRGGIVLVAPLAVKVLVRELAPDLWTFRSLVIELPLVAEPSEFAVPDSLAFLDLLRETPAEVTAEDAERAWQDAQAALEKVPTFIGAIRPVLAAAVQLRLGRRVDDAEKLLAQIAARPNEHPEAEGAWRARIEAELGSCAAAKQDYQKAIQHFELAIANAGDVPDAERAAWWNFLGLACLELQNDQKALHAFESAIAIGGSAFGVDAPETLAAIYNLAAAHHGLGHYVQALTYARKAFETCRQKWGPDHVMTAVSMSSLAVMESELGNLTESRKLAEKSVRILEKTPIASPQSLSQAYGALAGVQERLGNLIGAKDMCERRLQVDEQQFGSEHSRVARSLLRLGRVELGLARPSDALKHLERSLAIYEKDYGPNDERLVNVLVELGAACRANQDFGTAKKYAKRALSISEATLGPTHPQVARDLSNLAAVYMDLGVATNAKTLLERSLGIYENAYGPKHVQVGRTHCYLGALAHSVGDMQAARAHFDQAWPTLVATLGPNDPEVLDLRRVISTLDPTGGAATQTPTAKAKSRKRH